MGFLGAAIGSGLGGILGGVLGGSGGNIPRADYKKPTLDQGTQYQLGKLQEQADRPMEEYEKESKMGLEQGAGIQSAISQAGSPEISAALKARAGKSYSADLAKLSRQQDIEAFNEKQAREKMAYGLGFRKKQIDQNIAEYERAAQAQQEAYDFELESARNAAITSVLGQTGKFVGMGLAQGESLFGSGQKGEGGMSTIGSSMKASRAAIQ